MKEGGGGGGGGSFNRMEKKETLNEPVYVI